MNVTVIGTGYVGLVTGTCLAELGNNVVCLDVDADKIAMLKNGECPIYEPGLKEMIQRNVAARRLQFTTDVAFSVDHGLFQFIAVGTPPATDGSADLQYVYAAARNIAVHARGMKIIVNKSTVPVGTGDEVERIIISAQREERMGTNWIVVSNPEFLKEGAAIEDFMRPDRIVIGMNQMADAYINTATREALTRLYAPLNRNHQRTIWMGRRAAELTKYAANAMLATRISFMNELACLAEKVHVDIDDVRRGIGSDTRIGYDFLYAGLGYGGSCFPKDVRALSETGMQNDCQMHILDSVHYVNQNQRINMLKKIDERFNHDLGGKTIAVWGLSFKPNTDDMREAPSLDIIKRLIHTGVTVNIYDPVAQHVAYKELEALCEEGGMDIGMVNRCVSMLDAVAGADALLICTEWKEFKTPSFHEMARLMKHKIIFDGRNLYNLEQMEEHGFEYYGVGRSAGAYRAKN
jgi:UDPglucose 6-dehydrogenase